MTQLSFHLKTKETSNTKKEDVEEAMYEPEFKHLDFILLPYALLLGLKHKKDISSLNGSAQKLLFQLFCKRKNKEEKKVTEAITKFLEIEHGYFKRDSQKPLRTDNILSYEEFRDILIRGALEIKSRHQDILKVKASFRKQLPKSDIELQFSKIARYINNGLHDENWYEETGKEIENLFAGFDKELIVSLLAATSIRASLPSNVTKFYKVLDQFFEGKVYTALVGNRKKPKKMKTWATGTLDATLYHLNQIKEGLWLADSKDKKKNGRKIKAFADAMLENIYAIVVDIWITRAFGCERKRKFRSGMASESPKRTVYDAIEWYLQTVGNLTNKTPRGLCATIWSGKRREKSKGDTRYTFELKKRLDHGLFAGQYGKLVGVMGKGIKFEVI